MPKDVDASTESCPVDSATRAAWLKSRETEKSLPLVDTLKKTESGLQNQQCDSCSSKQIGTLETLSWYQKSLWDSLTTWPAPPEERSKSDRKLYIAQKLIDREGSTKLGLDREVSSIPRALSSIPDGTETQTQVTKPAANCEQESGVSMEGNWIYPSEKMFFDAMRRKGYSSEVADMKTIVPIHNAVNEQAWKEIKAWEKPWGSETCGGPKLHSFKGLPSSMTPKARFNTLLGYMAPFDRHDWIVDRCGKRIEYVIDFYVGKNSQGKENSKLNFYLDVRPKLNTWEGLKMRTYKIFGLA